jgi:RNA polymerase sigma-70 factor (ECF subfamily)
VQHRQFLKHFLVAHAPLKAYLTASTGNATEADDLLQEVSSVLWEKFAHYDPSRPFLPWALGVARLEVLKRREALARTRRALSGKALEALAETAGEAAGDLEERRSHLRSCVEGLAQETREVVRLRYLESLPIADLAARVGKNVGAIEMTLVRARRALRECVERKLAEA